MKILYVMNHIKLFEQYNDLVYKYNNLIYTNEFKRWFGDWEEAYKTGDYSDCSKLVSADGMPMIVYHATMHEWEKFDMNLATAGSHDMGDGLYFADKANSSTWSSYASQEGGYYRNNKMVARWIAGFKYGSEVAYQNRHEYDWSDYCNIVIEGFPFTKEYLEYAKKYKKIHSTNQDELSEEELQYLRTPYNRREHRYIDIEKFGIANLAREALKVGKTKLTIKKMYVNARRLKFVDDGYIDHTGSFSGENDNHLYDCKIEGSLDDINQGIVYDPKNAWFFN